MPVAYLVSLGEIVLDAGDGTFSGSASFAVSSTLLTGTSVWSGAAIGTPYAKEPIRGRTISRRMRTSSSSLSVGLSATSQRLPLDRLTGGLTGHRAMTNSPSRSRVPMAKSQRMRGLSIARGRGTTVSTPASREIFRLQNVDGVPPYGLGKG